MGAHDGQAQCTAATAWCCSDSLVLQCTECFMYTPAMHILHVY
jgi:hypothetical protein